MKLFQSNQMTGLGGVFCERNSAWQKNSDPFEPLTVVVQSFGLGQWLKLQLAEHSGISANIDCVLPATFLWRLYRSMIPETQSLAESPFERDQLVFRIMRLLDANPRLSGAVTSYLSGPGERDLRLYQLSGELAGLFDEYLMYRPGWILDWERGNRETRGHEDWQSGLWRLLQEDLAGAGSLHRASLHQRLMTELDNSPPPGLSRLSIFGLSTMPPLQLQTFEALSRHLPVDVYFLNPCAHYWGDIVSAKDQARRSIRTLLGPGDADSLADDDYIEVGNPLLSSLGKQGREYFELLLESGEVESEEFFFRSEGEQALDYVRNDILELTFGGEFDTASSPAPVSRFDESIQVHIAHSPLREVEILQDRILRAMDEDPSIQPSDVIVMVPDISRYAPYIHAVFSGDMPYRVADQASLADAPLLSGVMSLLDLPVLRITATEVMDLLEVPAVMRRFDLCPEDLPVIARWISQSGIRWGLDGSDKQEHWNLPAENQNTWQFGLDRLLLGFALSPDQGIWQDVLPMEITATDTVCLGRLGHFISQLRAYRDRLNASLTADEWMQLVSDLLQDFFDPRLEETLTVSRVLQATEAVTSRAARSGYGEPMSRTLVLAALRDTLSSPETGAALISGGITFANLVPMRSIPFRMVCLLGMNDGDYPRDKRPNSFDLIAAGSHEKGDRSRRLDDRYLFLEALLSASDIFYVSYVGRGQRDNKEKPPSVVVREWLDYLHQVFEKVNTTEHALQPFNARYYREGPDRSYNATWYPALAGESAPTAFITEALAEDESLASPSLETLLQFYRHPGRFFLGQRLGVHLGDDEISLRDVEPFELDNLEQFQIADGALRELVAGRTLDAFRTSQLLSGRLLPGVIGRQHLERQLQRATNIFETAAGFLSEPATEVREELIIGSRRVPLALANLHGNTLVHCRAGAGNARDKLQAWIQHLAVNLVQPGTDSVLVGRGRQDEADIFRLAAVDKGAAYEQLAQLLAGFDAGCRTPFFLPPGASEMFMKERERGGELPEVLARTRRLWLSENHPGRESDDRYWQRLIDEDAAGVFDMEFASRVSAIWQPLLENARDEI